MNINNFEHLIAIKNRFRLNKTDLNEIKEKLLNKNILITGAAGSIGKKFSQYLVKNFKFKKIFFLDKNENALTDLNRDLNIINLKNKITFLCLDITSADITKILNKNKIDYYFNFAALKHVRSEENENSLEYMYMTNVLSFFNVKNKPRHLKLLFSISTDKAVNPVNCMGYSKKLMENKLYLISKKFKNLHVSSARFANVAFSRGSILENIVKRTINKEKFGVPKKIKRFFITHDEAVHLCLHAVLKRNHGKIILPSDKILYKQDLILDMCKKILKLFKYRSNFINSYKNKKIITGNTYNVLVTTNNIRGQKNEENFLTEKESYFLSREKNIMTVPLPNNKNQLKSRKTNFNYFYNICKKMSKNKKSKISNLI